MEWKISFAIAISECHSTSWSRNHEHNKENKIGITEAQDQRR